MKKQYMLLMAICLMFSFTVKSDECITVLLQKFKSEQLSVKRKTTFVGKQIINNKEISGLLKSGACGYKRVEKIEKVVNYTLSGNNLKFKIELMFISDTISAKDIYKQIINNPPDKVCLMSKDYFHYLIYQNQIIAISGSAINQEELRKVKMILNDCLL